MIYINVIFCFFSAVAVADDDTTASKLNKLLQGDYEVVSGERGGKASATDQIRKVSIENNKITTIVEEASGKLKTVTATFTIDATQKPIQIDVKADEGNRKGVTTKGIISIEKDILKICTTRSEKRPTEFKTTAENQNQLLTLKKIKH